MNDIVEKIIKNSNNIVIDKSGIYHFKYEGIAKCDINIKISSNIEVEIDNYFYGREINLDIVIEKNSKVNWHSYNYSKDDKNINIVIYGDSILKTYLLELSEGTTNNTNVDLIDINASLDYNLAAYSDADTNKFKIKVNHLAPKTVSNIINTVLLNEDASTNLDVTSYIKKGCFASSAYQKSKVVTLNDKCRAEVNPVLLIEEYDVMGGHGATVSKIRDEEIYYLQSRGIRKDDAKRIIAVGNILEHAPNNIKEKVSEYLERRMENARIS